MKLLSVALAVGTTFRAPAQRLDREGWASRVWSWSFGAQLSQVTLDTLQGDTLLRRYDERNLRFTLGLKGFAYDPSLAQFNLDLGDSFLRFKEEGTNVNRVDWRASLRLLPYGKAPLTVYAGQGRYSYGGDSSAGEDLAAQVGSPLRATFWGAKLAVKRTYLANLTFGFDGTRIDYVDRSRGTGKSDRQFLTWEGNPLSLQSHVFVERRTEDYPWADYSSKDLLVDARSQGDLGKRWTADVALNALRHSFSGPGFGTIRTDQTLLSAHAGSGGEKEDRADILYNGSFAGETNGHFLDVRYLWNLRDNLFVYPTVGYGLSRGPDRTSQGPQVGLGTAWTPIRGGTSLVLSALGLWNRNETTVPGTSSRTSALGYGLNLSAATGAAGFRLGLDGAVSRSKFEVGGDALTQLPDLGVPGTSSGLQDRSRARLTVSRDDGLLRTSAYAEWSRTNSSRNSSEDFRIEAWSGALQAGIGSWLSLSGTGAETRQRSPEEQQYRYVSGSLSVEPVEILSLVGTYGLVRGATPITSGYQIRTVGLSAGLTLWKVRLGGGFYRTVAELPSEPKRTDRAVFFSVSTGSSGILPIFAGGTRRGVVK